MALSEFEIARYMRISTNFVDKYEEFGDLVAGNYAAESLKDSELLLVEPFIKAEFISRGYCFEDDPSQETGESTPTL